MTYTFVFFLLYTYAYTSRKSVPISRKMRNLHHTHVTCTKSRGFSTHPHPIARIHPISENGSEMSLKKTSHPPVPSFRDVPHPFEAPPGLSWPRPALPPLPAPRAPAAAWCGSGARWSWSWPREDGRFIYFFYSYNSLCCRNITLSDIHFKKITPA